MPNNTIKKTCYIYIFAVCFLTAILQAADFQSFSVSQKYTIALVGILLYILLLCFSIYTKKPKNNHISLIILGAMLIHSWYILNTGIYERQHDIGNITVAEDGLINGGHLGYIEYFVKNHHMPDFAPFDVFAYYHPPAHHILASIIVTLNMKLGVRYDLAFENVQVLTLLYFGIMCMVVYSVLCKLIDDESSYLSMFSAMALIAFHPSLIYMSGYLNNDMLTLLMMSIIIYADILFIDNPTVKNLIRIALAIGFGALCKLNACIFALPTAIIFLIHFIRTSSPTLRSKTFRAALKHTKNPVLIS